MLVLTRGYDESIIIGGNVEVKVIHIGKGKVKLGITAPKEITVNRKEIEDAKNSERANA